MRSSRARAEVMLKALVKMVFGFAVFVGIAVAVLRIFFVDIATVGHNAMAPTLFFGDQIAIWRDSFLDIGDITICKDPSDPTRYVLGRIIGKAGFHIETKRGQLNINNTIVMREFNKPHRFTDTNTGQTDDMAYGTEELSNVQHLFYEREGAQFTVRPTNIKKGLYLLGDNRTYVGEDSRYFGEVDPATCLGQVIMRLKPGPPTGSIAPHGWMNLID